MDFWTWSCIDFKRNICYFTLKNFCLYIKFFPKKRSETWNSDPFWWKSWCFFTRIFRWNIIFSVFSGTLCPTSRTREMLWRVVLEPAWTNNQATLRSSLKINHFYLIQKNYFFYCFGFGIVLLIRFPCSRRFLGRNLLCPGPNVL